MFLHGYFLHRVQFRCVSYIYSQCYGVRGLYPSFGGCRLRSLHDAVSSSPDDSSHTAVRRTNKGITEGVRLESIVCPGNEAVSLMEPCPAAERPLPARPPNGTIATASASEAYGFIEVLPSTSLLSCLLDTSLERLALERRDPLSRRGEEGERPLAKASEVGLGSGGKGSSAVLVRLAMWCAICSREVVSSLQNCTCQLKTVSDHLKRGIRLA